MKARVQNVHRALQETLPRWGVLVLESHHSSDFTMHWRTHGFVKVVFFLDGSGHFDIGDTSFAFSSGDVFAIPPGVANRIRDAPEHPSALYIGCIASHVVASDPDVLETLGTVAIPGPSRASTAIATQLRKLLFQQEQATDTVSFNMLSEAWRLLRLVHEATRPVHSGTCVEESTGKSNSSPASADLVDVRDYVDRLRNSFMDARSVDQAAADCGLPRRRFTALFRQVTGTSWLAFVRQLAVEHAETLLAETDLPVVSVAFEAGFADVSTFYRHFKRKTGQSPAAYRRAKRRDGMARVSNREQPD